MTKPLDPDVKAARAAARVRLREEQKAAKKAATVTTTLTSAPTLPVELAVTPLVPRPVVNQAKEESMEYSDALVWEVVGWDTDKTEAWQWRAWFQGTIVGMVSWSYKLQLYCAAAMHKRVGAYSWQRGNSEGPETVTQDVPPSEAAIEAVLYAVVDLRASGTAVEATGRALEKAGEGPKVDAARAALIRLEAAHLARYEVDEINDDAVHRCNTAVQTAINMCTAALTAVEQAKKTAEQRSTEAVAALEASKGAIVEFNSKHAASGRRG